MSYKIRYAYFSIPGIVRGNHEDNLYVSGKHLDMISNGTDGIVYGETWSGEMPLFCVFDGMGGESAGEAAAYIAANTVARSERKRDRIGHLRDVEGSRRYLKWLCQDMNREVIAYSEENSIRSMGTTASCLLFSDESICCANVGDSRIYQANRSDFTQVTEDQVLESVFYSKPPLLQYIGMREEELTLRPEICVLPCRSGNCYLICTDGVSDMIANDKLAQILHSAEDPACILEKTRKAVLDAGARDNATAVLCSVE